MKIVNGFACDEPVCIAVTLIEIWYRFARANAKKTREKQRASLGKHIYFFLFYLCVLYLVRNANKWQWCCQSFRGAAVLLWPIKFLLHAQGDISVCVSAMCRKTMNNSTFIRFSDSKETVFGRSGFWFASEMPQYHHRRWIFHDQSLRVFTPAHTPHTPMHAHIWRDSQVTPIHKMASKEGYVGWPSWFPNGAPQRPSDE